MSAVPNVGFVGLGTMGRRMVRRLLTAGYDVAVHDIAPAAIDAAAADGAIGCASAREVADRAEVVLVSLPSPDTVREVAADLAGGGSIRIYVDLSTTGPATAEDVGELMSSSDVGAVDAPVSGGPAGAESGKLTIMVSGSDHAVAAAWPLLEHLGSTRVIVGDRPGQAQTAKVINNLLSATALVATAEALTLGVKAGLDPSTLLDVVNASSGQSNASATKFPQQVLTRRFDHGFRLDLMAKDVRLCLAEAQRRHVPMPLGGVVEQLWNIAETVASEGDDCTAIARMFEQWSNVTIETGAP